MAANYDPKLSSMLNYRINWVILIDTVTAITIYKLWSL